MTRETTGGGGSGDAGDRETIDVLLVDDNELWARSVADDLERADDGMTVRVTHSTGGATRTLDEGPVDCVVIGYPMPDADGPQLVDRIREGRPNLPCILVGGRCDDGMPAPVVDDASTDYLVTDPTVDLVPQLRNAIRSAVDRRRLRAAVAESEHRFCTLVSVRDVTERSAAPDPPVEATIRLHEGRHYLSESIRRSDALSANVVATVHDTLPKGERRFLQFVSVEGAADPFREAVSDHPAVEAVDDVDGGSGFQVTVDGPVPESTVAAVGGAVRETTVEAGTAELGFRLEDQGELPAVVDAVESAGYGVSVSSLTDADAAPAVTDPFVDLTGKQSAALRAAHHMGYFERPRRNSATDVAESLGIAHSTFLQHLRAAQRKVFDRRYGASRDDR